jgi:uncharacterized protein
LKAICDTSVLIAFDTLDKIHILHNIFTHIIIPTEVLEELKIEQSGFELKNWLKVKKITNTDLFNSFSLNLDKGESAAITLSLEEKSDLILLDDKEARKVALGLGLKIIGTAGILLLAKRKGLLSSVAEEINKLENRINFRLSEELKRNIIEKAGE